MSHGRTEIDLADGLTVLTGPNNCGKSAVVAALQILAANGKSNHVMRHGEKRCRITVETDDGHEICWERKKTVVKYTLDGEDIHRVGTSVPESLQELLRLNQVEAKVGKTEHEYDIHFGEQKSPVFLLDQPGGRAASFFASSSDASRLVEMQHLHRQNVREKRAEAKRLRQDQQSFSERLEHYQPLAGISERVDQATDLLQQIDDVDKQRKRLLKLADSVHSRQQQCERLRLQLRTLNRLDTATTTPEALLQTRSRITQLRTTVNQLADYLSQREGYGHLSECLNDLTAPPKWNETKQISLLIDNLDSAHHRQATATRVLDCCSTIANPPEMQPADSCRRVLGALLAESSRQQHLVSLNSAMASLQPVPKIADTTGLATLITKLTVAHSRTNAAQSVRRIVKPLEEPPAEHATARAQLLITNLQHRQNTSAVLSRIVTYLDALTPPEEPIDPAGLTNTIERLTTSLKETDAAAERSITATQQAASCETQIRTFVATNPKCATCGADINPDTLLSHVPGLHNHSTSDVTGTKRPNGSEQP